jgi:hypothetical protein
VRGQWREVKGTENNITFDDFWRRGTDIMSDWNKIESEILAYQVERE